MLTRDKNHLNHFCFCWICVIIYYNSKSKYHSGFVCVFYRSWWKKPFFGGFSGIEKRFLRGNFHVLKISLQWFQEIIAIVAPNHCNNSVKSSQSFPGIIAMIFRNWLNRPLFSLFSAAISLKTKNFQRRETDILALNSGGYHRYFTLFTFKLSNLLNFKKLKE